MASPYALTSFWHASLPPDDVLDPRPGLPGDLDVDVAIVGAGFTGLWTAYELRRRDPSLRIAVLEAEIAGFGASGRNGGWCSALLPMSLDAMAAEHGRDAAVAMQRAMFAAVDEVGAAATREGIDCHWAKDGTLTLATAPSHTSRLRAALDEARRFGLGDADLRWLDRAEARSRLDATGTLGALFTPHCAAIHPARLARGLARAVESAHVPIYEKTRVRSLAPGLVRTDRGVVRAEVVVRATEGYTRSLAGEERTLVPVYSLMIATEPVPAERFEALGWDHRATFHDARHVIVYGQRTADDRIAFGGRGAPYHYGSGIEADFEQVPEVFDELRRVLVELFPSLADIEVTHRWGGALGVPRDWQCSVGLDRSTGLAWAGGYVGDGVATTNLAGRTLADLITGTESDLTRLPWVGHRSPRWEPEPLRWLGINAMRRLAASADRSEVATGTVPKGRTWLLGRVLGH